MKIRSSLAVSGAAALVVVAACQSPAPTATAVPPPEPIPAPTIGLWEAAASGDIDALVAHRAAGTNLNALQPELGITALVAATAGGQSGAVDWLLDHGVDVNARSGDGNTALHAAAFLGAADIARKLLERGVNVTASNDNGQTVWQTLALDWQTTSAVASGLRLTLDRVTLEAGRAEIATMLEPYLARLSDESIWLAAYAGDAAAVKSHIDRGADVNQRHDESGATLLTVAALLDHQELAALLIDVGADVNARNYGDATTALHAAAFVGRADMVEMLLDNGADPAVVSDTGGTPLAAAQLDWATTQYLAAVMQVPVEQAPVMAGKATAVEVLLAKLDK